MVALNSTRKYVADVEFAKQLLTEPTNVAEYVVAERPGAISLKTETPASESNMRNGGNNMVDCSMCGRKNLVGKEWHRHHVIPRDFGGDDLDIIDVCPSCHPKADGAFWRHINYPFGTPSGGKSWTCPNKRKKTNIEYNKKLRTMHVYYSTMAGMGLWVRCVVRPSGKIYIHSGFTLQKRKVVPSGY